MANTINIPITMELQLSDKCNHACPWCVYRRSTTLLSIDSARQAIVEGCGAGIKELIVSGGGEPLTHPGAYDILELARDLGMSVCLITNGELLHKQERRIASSCSFVRVSLDAGTAITHHVLHRTQSKSFFDQIIASMATLRSLSSTLVVGASFVVQTENAHEILEAAQLLKTVDVHYFLIKHDNRVKSPDRRLRWITRRQIRLARSYVDLEYRQPITVNCLPREIPVGLASMKLTILPDGGIYPCCHVHHSNCRIGNINNNSIRDIICGSRHSEAIKTFRRIPHECRLFRYASLLSYMPLYPLEGQSGALFI